MLEPQPVLSVVTISYNQCRYLRHAMASVLEHEKDNDDVEYIVMDGGSTDGSAKLIASHSDHLSYWQSQPDGGPAKALSDAIGHCRGQFLMYLNSDDFFVPDALKDMISEIKASPSFDVYYGNGYTFDQRTNRLSRTYSDQWNLRNYAAGDVSIFQQACCLRLKLVREVGGFNEANSTCWDGELLFDLARAGARFRKLKKFYAVFRLHDDSISGGQARQSIYHADRQRIAAKVPGVTYRGPGPMASIRKVFRQPKTSMSKLRDRWFPDQTSTHKIISLTGRSSAPNAVSFDSSDDSLSLTTSTP